MSLTKVFDSLSDAILVVNQVGDVSYFNRSASELINGTSIETIGIDRLRNMLKLVLSEQLNLPCSFKVVIDKEHGEYQVTISKLYTFFIVALSKLPLDTNLHKHSKSNEHRTPNNHETLIKTFFRDQFKSLVALYDAELKDLGAAPPYKALNYREKFEMLMDVLFSDIPEKPYPIYDLIKISCATLKNNASLKSHELSIYTASDFQKPQVRCRQDWFTFIFLDCLLFVATDSLNEYDVETRVDEDSQYLTIHIFTRDNTVTSIHRKLIMKHKFDSKGINCSHDLITHDSSTLTVSRYLTEKLRGNIEVIARSPRPRIIIKLPIGDTTFDEHELLIKQSDLLLKELADLKSKFKGGMSI